MWFCLKLKAQSEQDKQKVYGRWRKEDWMFMAQGVKAKNHNKKKKKDFILSYTHIIVINNNDYLTAIINLLYICICKIKPTKAKLKQDTKRKEKIFCMSGPGKIFCECNAWEIFPVILWKFWMIPKAGKYVPEIGISRNWYWLVGRFWKMGLICPGHP